MEAAGRCIDVHLERLVPHRRAEAGGMLKECLASWEEP